MKEPWQMREAEWRQAIDAARIDYTGGQGPTGLAAVQAALREKRRLRMDLPDVQVLPDLAQPAGWREVVQEALRRGLPVPLQVQDELEHLLRVDARYPETAPHRRATPEELAQLRAELDARYFPGPEPCPWCPGPCYTHQRLQGAPGG